MLQPFDGPHQGPIVLSVSVAQELKVGASALTRRKGVAIQPVDNDIYYGFDNTVTDTTGFEISKGDFVVVPYKGTVPIWLVAKSGTVDVKIAELQ